MIRYVSRTIILLAILGLGWYLWSSFGTASVAPTKIQQRMSTSTTMTQDATVMLDYGNDTTQTFVEPIHAQESVFDLLKQTTADHQLSFVYKDYGAGMGMFIQSIGGIGENDHSKWWQFWINGTYSPTGASDVMVHSGDIVKFVFTSEDPTK